MPTLSPGSLLSGSHFTVEERGSPALVLFRKSHSWKTRGRRSLASDPCIMHRARLRGSSRLSGPVHLYMDSNASLYWEAKAVRVREKRNEGREN